MNVTVILYIDCTVKLNDEFSSLFMTILLIEEDCLSQETYDM